MTTYSWPTSGTAFRAASMSWGQSHNGRAASSSLNGAIQTTSLPGARWGLTVNFPQQSYAERAQVEAFFTRLSGMEHRASIYDLSRPQRRGTCALTGVTASAAAQFAMGLTLNGCGASTTLLAGDWLSVPTANGAQLLQAVVDAAANGSGVMTIETRPSLRGAVAAGAAVTLDKPSALFIQPEPKLDIPRGGSNICPPWSVTLMEVFS